MTDQQYSIAVLLPTRGRTDALTRSVSGLVSRAKDVSQIKIMLGFDEDDSTGLSHFKEELQPWLDENSVNYTAMLFEPLGYGRLNEYVNALANGVNADWYCFWNDDALMETDSWDAVIRSHTGKFKLLAFHTHRDHPYSIFPIVPRAWLEALGHLSPHQLSDAWLSQQAYMLDVWERIDVNVTHDRHDLTGNNEDETFKNRPMFEGNPRDPKDFHHISWTHLRLEETEKLSNYMQSNGIDITWWNNVKEGLQDPWEKLKANDVNNQMSCFTVRYPRRG